MPRVAVIAVLLVTVCACDAPWEGPSLPTGSHWISVRAIASGPENCPVSQALIAATTVDQVEARVQATCAGHGCNATVGCWPGLVPPPGSIFVALYRYDGRCGAATKGGEAVSASTLYFIVWVGRGTGQCGEAALAPAFALYAVARSLLPTVGVLHVELQIQDVTSGTATYDTEVALG